MSPADYVFRFSYISSRVIIIRPLSAPSTYESANNDGDDHNSFDGRCDDPIVFLSINVQLAAQIV